MIDKALEYLNWLYVGIGAIMLTAAGWLVASAAKAITVKTVTLNYQEEMRKLSEAAADKAVEKVLVSEALRKRDKELLESLTNIVINGLAAYPPIVREEAERYLKPLISSSEILIKSDKINQRKISKIEKSLKEHRDHEHKHRHDILTVLNFLIDSVNESTKNADKIVELQRKITAELNEEREEYININAS